MSKQSKSAPIAWWQIALASLLMVATLPGRTQGLGLITEPMLRDLRLDRVIYVDITPQAAEILAAIDEPLLELHKATLGHLSDEELTTLSRLLEKARQHQTKECVS